MYLPLLIVNPEICIIIQAIKNDFKAYVAKHFSFLFKAMPIKECLTLFFLRYANFVTIKTKLKLSVTYETVVCYFTRCLFFCH